MSKHKTTLFMLCKAYIYICVTTDRAGGRGLMGRRGMEDSKQRQQAKERQTWGAGRVQADVELVSSAGHLAKEALQGAHLVLLKGLVQVAAHQPHCTSLDHWPPRDSLHLLHALLRSMLGHDYNRAAGLVLGLRGAGWGL